jgi:hypothetical protein
MNRNIYKRQWEVESFENEKVYKVSEKHTGEFVCSCPHNIFRKIICKHILEVKGYDEIKKVADRVQKALNGFKVINCIN